MKTLNIVRMVALSLLSLAAVPRGWGEDKPITLKVNWDKVLTTSKTTPTLQVVVNPPLRRGNPIHDNAFRSLDDLKLDYVRYVPWLPYPKLGVAELEPPATAKHLGILTDRSNDNRFPGGAEGTFRDAELQHHSSVDVQNRQACHYPADPIQVTWDYNKGTELRDPT